MSDYGEKTRGRIKTALEELIETGPGKGLTVSALLKQSGVARSTFYVYYENFEDLLEELATDYAAEVIRLIRGNRSEGASWADSYRDAYRIFIQFIDQHKKAYAMLLRNARTERLFLEGVQKYLYDQYLADFPDKDPTLLRYSAYACTSYVYSILRQWAEGGFRESPEELGKLLPDSIQIATDLFGQK